MATLKSLFFVVLITYTRQQRLEKIKVNSSKEKMLLGNKNI